MKGAHRWVLVACFFLSSTINYADRQILSGVAPLILEEFQLRNSDFGLLQSAFSITYALGAPVAGWLIDRLGLTRGIILALSVWSLATSATGLATGVGFLAGCRAVLGIAQAGGIPAAGKAARLYLKPAERALGASINQGFLAVGILVAGPVAVALAHISGWRAAFLIVGLAGLVWIPLWLLVSRSDRNQEAGPSARPPVASLLKDRRIWVLAAANFLAMILYSLWSNWTVLYLVRHAGADLKTAAWWGSLPLVVSTAGAITGGWYSLRLAERGVPVAAARLRACGLAAAFAMVTAAVPWMPGAGWAAAGISASFFAVAAFSSNLYALPLDLFDPGHAALAISILTSAYGLMQTLVSPLIGWVIDRAGYSPVCLIASLTPLAAYALVRSGRVVE